MTSIKDGKHAYKIITDKELKDEAVSQIATESLNSDRYGENIRKPGNLIQSFSLFQCRLKCF